MSPEPNLNKRLRKLSLINEAGNTLHSIVDIDELLEKILSFVEQVF